MNTSIQLYKEFVDGLANIAKGVFDIWVKEKGWPKIPENEKINKFLEKLNDEEKSLVADILQQARNSGIHDTLAYINERMDLDGMRITIKGIEIAYQPFDTELYYDWVCRSEGDSWPDVKV